MFKAIVLQAVKVIDIFLDQYRKYSSRQGISSYRLIIAFVPHLSQKHSYLKYNVCSKILKECMSHEWKLKHQLGLTIILWIFSIRLPPGGHFNLICAGVCGDTNGKLTHPQTEAGPSINKNRSNLRLCTIRHERKLTKIHKYCNLLATYKLNIPIL